MTWPLVGLGLMIPLLIALLMIEFVDLVFAVDSVPAIFAITDDPFIVYTSNIFAILGLRAMYFALAAMLPRFRYLKPAMAAVLVFIGGKIFVADLAGWEKFPASLSLGITLALLGASGQVGHEWQRLLKQDASHALQVLAPTHQSLDLAQPDAVRAWLQMHQPELIVNIKIAAC